MVDVQKLLRYIVDVGASDLHLRAGARPVVRIDGSLKQTQFDRLTPEDTAKIGLSFLNERQRRTFETRHEGDFSYSARGLARFRGNIFLQRGSVHIALRLVPAGTKTFEELNLPSILKKLAENVRGLILITGTTGSGKSTTLAAFINHINSTRAAHIITIEDPIEYLHVDNKSMISQRELEIDTLDYSAALRHVVRQDPDVLFIGEMRDLETVRAALTAAQMGTLVLSTIHTIDAVQTATRVVDMFPPYQQNQIRLQFADTLKGIVSQRLLPLASGKGRIPACEVLSATGLVKKLIEENKLNDIIDVMEQGEYYGMQTFNQSLLQLYNQGLIKLEDAIAAANKPEELMLRIRGIAQGGTDK